MKIMGWVLVAFIFIRAPELYSLLVEKRANKQVKETLTTYYGNDPIEKIGIKFPDVVRAQIALETRWLKSKVYRENGNMFGMKESSRNWDCGTQHGHANYVCKEDGGTVCAKHSTDVAYMRLSPQIRSLYDYRDWQQMRFAQAAKKGMKIPETNEEYIFFLQHLPGGGAYAEDPAYPNKLRHIINL